MNDDISDDLANFKDRCGQNVLHSFLLENGTSSEGAGVHDTIDVSSSSCVRSILKQKKNRSSNEKAVECCLSLLCSTPEAHELFDSVIDVFGDLCFDQFFKGDCVQSLCSSCHDFRLDSSDWADHTVWSAALFVICHASQPDIRVPLALARHFDSTNDVDRVLAFSKCVVKLKREFRASFAAFLSVVLGRRVGKENALTRILMLIHSQVNSSTFDEIVINLGVFDGDTTRYQELLNFLNYRSHKIPPKHLATVIRDATKIGIPKINGLLDDINEFFKRLSSEESSQIGHRTVECLTQMLMKSSQHEQKLPKRVSFQEQINVVEFSENVDPKDLDLNPIQNPTKPCSTSYKVNCVVNTFGNICLDWLLKDDCTWCSLQHEVPVSFLEGKPVDELCVAAEFYVDVASPKVEIVQTFVDVLSQSTKFESVLNFHKCAERLSAQDSAEMTFMIWSRLAKRIGNEWAAAEMVMSPSILSPKGFSLDDNILTAVMNEAVERKVCLTRFVTKAILRRVAQSSSLDSSELVLKFVRKFVLKSDAVRLPWVDHFPTTALIGKSSFFNDFSGALAKGNSFVVVCEHLKFAVDRCLDLNPVADSLFEFLSADLRRAGYFSDMMHHTRFLEFKTRKSIRHLLLSVGANLGVNAFKSGQIEEAFEIFQTLRRFQFTCKDLAVLLVNCRVLAAKKQLIDATNVFLVECLQPILDCNGTCSKDIVDVCGHLFTTYVESSAVDECLVLFEGILKRQKSLTFPLNIVEFYEPTLRNSFRRPFDREVRRLAVKLFLDVEECCTAPLSRIACRSLMIVIVKEVHAFGKSRPRGLPHVFQPVVRKVMFKCLENEAYPRHSSSCRELSLFSSMTEEEIEIYLLWWLKLFLLSRSSKGVVSYDVLTVRVIENVVQDDSNWPIHFRLRRVENGIPECAGRLNRVVKSLISIPLSNVMFRRVGSGRYELSGRAVRALCQAVVSSTEKYNFQGTKLTRRLCTFCSDESFLERTSNCT